MTVQLTAVESLVGAITAVSGPVTHPPGGDALTVTTLELTDVTRRTRCKQTSCLSPGHVSNTSYQVQFQVH